MRTQELMCNSYVTILYVTALYSLVLFWILNHFFKIPKTTKIVRFLTEAGQLNFEPCPYSTRSIVIPLVKLVVCDGIDSAVLGTIAVVSLSVLAGLWAVALVNLDC